MQAFDVVINGGGMVGLALACALGNSNLRVAIVERSLPTGILPSDRLTLRVSAINAASRRLLQCLEVWDVIIAHRATPYQVMEVWEHDGFGKITFDSSRLGHPQLGHVIENQIIRQALWRRAGQLANVTLITSAFFQQISWEKNEVFITLDDDQIITARLVVAADGSNSWLRQYADIPLTFWDYHHHALVATILTERPHGNIARQLFYSDGILAFLPLSDQNFCSIVWSLPPEQAQERLTQPKKYFNNALAMAFDLTLGRCELQGERQSFALNARYARNFAAHRLVLIGDAAHTMHPLAGQGVNLGFMDMALLVEELQKLQKAGKDIGHYPYLRYYERNRKLRAALMLASMQAFQALFDGRNPLKKWLRNSALWLADTLPDIKILFIRQAMGLNDMAAWLIAKSFY